MKKTRIISMLLSAMMAVSSFPLVASASGAQAIAEDVTPTFSTTASGAVSDIPAEDGYMSVVNRKDRNASFQFAYNFKYGAKYKVTFDARLSVPSNSNYSFRVTTLTKGTDEYVSYSKSGSTWVKGGSYHWMSDATIASRNGKTTAEVIAAANANGGNGGTDNISQGTLDKDPTWKTFSFEYQFIDKPADVTSDTVLDRIGIYAGTNGVFTQAFDVDNWKLEVFENGSWKQLEFYDFETAPAMGTGAHNTFRNGINSNANAEPDKVTKLVHVPASETAYKRVAGTAGVNTTVSLTSGMTLEPGVYVLSADVRYAHSNAIAAPDNTTVVEVAGTIGGSAAKTTVNLDHIWKRVSNTFMVKEATTFDGVSFTSKGSTATPANANNPIDFRNVTLTLAQSLAPEVSGEENVTIIDFPEYDFTVDGGAAIELGDDMPASFEFGNKYIRIYGRKNNWAGFNVVTSGLNFEDGKDYYLSYDLRASQNIASNALGDSLLTFCNATGGRLNNIVFTASSNKNGNHINKIDNSKWITVEVPYTQSGATKAQVQSLCFIGQYSGAQMIANDFDNFAVYYYNGTEKVYIYQEDFQDEATGELTDELVANFKVFRNNARWAGALQIAEDSVYYTANTKTVNYTPATETVLEPGVYTFTTDFAYGTHDASKIKVDTKAGTYNGYDYVANEVYENLNAYNVTADITLGDGQTFVSEQTRAGDGWASPTIVFSVFEPTTLSSINWNLDAANDIMLKNAKLTCVAFDTVALEDETNFLDGAVIKPINADVEDVDVDPNGFLNVAERTSDLSHYVTVPFNTPAVAGRTYYVSFDIACAGEGAFCVRPKVNVTTTETQGYLNANYVVPAEGSEIGSFTITNKDGAQDPSNSYVRIDNPGYEGKTFIGKVTPTANNNTFYMTFDRGPGFYPAAFNIDNLKIWYVDGGKDVVVVENDFDTAGDISGITALVPLTHEIPKDHTLITPANPTETTSVIYDLEIPEENAVDGGYTFRADFRTAANVGDVALTITYTFGDGTTKKLETTIDSAWSSVAFYRNVEGTTLESITITYDAAVALQMADAKLMIAPKREGGIPNVGIVMMLLKKRGGTSTRPVKTQFIKDGELNSAPVILDKAAPKQQTVADAGFYTKLADNQPTKITYVTEDGNSFIRISDLDAGQRGIMYNTGVELQPGTYTFTVDLRVSEKEGEPNYTAYGWRTETKDSMMMRTILQNPDNVGSGNYAANDPVDKDTVMNPSGAVTSTQIVVTREWTTYTDTVVLEKPTVAIFKIGGGMSGNPDAHGYDIDNLSLIGYVTPEAPAEDKDNTTEDVEGNLFVNGNFNVAPTIVEGDKFDDTAVNSWFQMDGDGYEKDNKGVDIMDKPIYIGHKITWENGYITCSGRTNNLRSFNYASGEKIAAGDYTLKFDIKTAVEGEKTVMRTSVVGYKNATVNDIYNVTNDWTTVTIDFTSDGTRNFSLQFYGGPNAAYKQSFCLDNLVLLKK